MKKKLRLFLILVTLSLAFSSCYPLNSSRYGDQGNRGQGDRHHRHQQDSRDHEDSRDHGDGDYNSHH